MTYEILYSSCDDDWDSVYTSLEEAATNFIDELSDSERKSAKSITLYKGVEKPAVFKDFLCVKSFLCDMQEAAYTINGDLVSDYLNDVSDEQEKELEDLIVDWAKRHNISPFWSTVESIEEIEFTVPDEWK